MKEIANGSVTSPLGFRAGVAASGIKKKGKLDLALIYSDQDCTAAGVFTKNQVAAAPVPTAPEPPADFDRRVEDDLEQGGRRAARAMEPQASRDVLDIDNRVVDDLADGDHQSGEHHRVDRSAQKMKDYGGSEERERYCCRADQRRSPFVEDGHQDHHHDVKDLFDLSIHGDVGVDEPEHNSGDNKGDDNCN